MNADQHGTGPLGFLRERIVDVLGAAIEEVAGG